MPSSSSSSEVSGWLKFSILALVSFQTAGGAVLTQYCRGVRKENFSILELVVMSEVLKMFFSVPLIFWLPEGGGGSQALSAQSHSLPGPSLLVSSSKRSPWFWAHRLYSLLRNSKKIIVLVVLYAISNMCGLTAVEFIGAPVFTVMCQMKIFTTAAFGVLLLNKSYSSAKWRALILLVIGCLMVSSPILKSLSDTTSSSSSSDSGSSSSSKVEEDMYGHSVYEQMYGLVAVTIQFTISGFASVYFEGMLKNKEEVISIWERNFQLAFYSVLFLSLTAYLRSTFSYLGGAADSLQQQSGEGQGQGEGLYLPFRGWSSYTAVLCVMNATAGLLVAATLKYADAVLKCFATGVAIIITSVLSYLLLDSSIDVFASLGMITTVLAIFNYTLDST